MKKYKVFLDGQVNYCIKKLEVHFVIKKQQFLSIIFFFNFFFLSIILNRIDSE